MLELTDGMTLELAGVDVARRSRSWSHARLGDLPAARPRPRPDTLFTGDLLFAGSIGRTDLPGGSYETILASLARVCLPLPDETVVLSGHGPATTIGAERARQPVPGWADAASTGPATGL